MPPVKTPVHVALLRFAKAKDNDSGDGKKLTNVLKMLIDLTHVDTEVSCVTTCEVSDSEWGD